MKRWLKWTVLGMLVLVVALVVAGGLSIDRLAKTGVERGSSYALGVNTGVDELDLSLLGGSLTMDGLQVANPQGYRSPFLMRTGQFDLSVQPRSVLGDELVVRSFELNGLELNVEQTLTGSNVREILKNLQRFESTDPEQPDPAEPGKRVKVDRIVIRNVVANFHLPAALAERPIAVRVPEIVLTEVTNETTGGVMISELTSRMMASILAAVTEKAQGVVPADVLNDLRGQLSQLTAQLDPKTRELIEQVQGQVKGVLGEGVQGIQKDVTEGVGKVFRGLGNGPSQLPEPE